MVSIGVSASTGWRYLAAHSRTLRSVVAANPLSSMRRAGSERAVPTRTPPTARRRMTSFFSSSGVGSSSMRIRSAATTLRVRSKGSAIARPRSSIELSPSRTSSEAMSTCVPSALVAASDAACRTTRSPNRSQKATRRTSSSMSGTIPCQRTSGMRWGSGVGLGGPPVSTLYSGAWPAASVRPEPGVDIVGFGGGDRLVEAGPSDALAERRPVPCNAILRGEEDREGEGDPRHQAPEHDRVVEVRVGENGRVEPGRPHRRQRGRLEEQLPSDAVEHRVEQEPQRQEHRPAEQRSADRDVQHEDERDDQEVVNVDERGESERRPQRDAGRHLARRSLGVQRLDQRLQELEQSQHAGCLLVRAGSRSRQHRRPNRSPSYAQTTDCARSPRAETCAGPARRILSCGPARGPNPFALMIRDLLRYATAPMLAAALATASGCASSSMPATPASGNVVPGVEVLLRDSLHLV